MFIQSEFGIVYNVNEIKRMEVVEATRNGQLTGEFIIGALVGADKVTLTTPQSRATTEKTLRRIVEHDWCKSMSLVSLHHDGFTIKS